MTSDQSIRTLPDSTQDRPIPLSFAQERVWFFDQLEPGQAAYNLTFGLRLRGCLDIGALERAIAQIITRHESLRTTFPAVDGKPYQAIADPPATPALLPVVRVASEAELAVRAATESAQPFDLSTDSLLRTTLFGLAGDEHILLCVVHHIVADGWSIGRLMDELGVLYSAFTAARNSPLTELPVQYADYVLWQREVLQGEALDAQLEYWRCELDDCPPLALPTDRPRPREQTFNGNRHWFRLPKQLSEDFLALARKEGATPFMALLAVFQLVLARHSGQQDFAVGVPIAGRPRSELRDLIGFFVNTLVLRADLSGALTFRDLLIRTRAKAIVAYEHEDVPLQRVATELNFARDLSRNALFQAVFAWQDVPAREPTLTGLAVSFYSSDETVNLVDLQFNCYPEPEGVLGHFIYNQDLFDSATIERLAGHFLNLLAGIVADPDVGLWQLPMLSGAERAQLAAWNDTAVEHAGPGTVVGLFQAQVGRSPEAVAVCSAGGELTYAELNAAANRLAHRLRGLGVGPESVVAVCAERSPELVVGLLGVLKAGAAYLPLDPSYPEQRLGFMLADSGACVLLTQSSVGSGLPDLAGVPRVLLDLADSAAESCADPVVLAGAANLAYVIYTSGSTGTPKAVMVDHRAVHERVLWMRTEYGLGPADRVLQFASVSFDTHVEEIYPALSTGATLVLAPADLAGDLPGFFATAEGSQVTMLDLPTPYWHELVRVAQAGQLHFPKRLRLTVIGADQAAADAVQVWHELVGCRLVNTYGPTEATVVATSADLSFEPMPSGGIPPIGRPVANTRLHVLDRDLVPVPVGVAGELFLAGVGLARGYLGRPGLTGDRFVPDPFGVVPGGRLYRTGDVARFRADGAVEFLGRADGQVKVRGFRIELGEIEARLREHPGVGQAVVAALADAGGGRRLVGYLVSAGAGAGAGVPGVEQLRAWLARSLPDYMVPSVFMVVDGLPLTPNGKLDRRALPVPEAGGSAGSGYRAPADSVELCLAEIWAQVLGVDRVGVDDNFFDLGGDSILSIQVIARARARGLVLSPRQLFAHQSVAALAAVAGSVGTDPAGEAAEQGPVTGAVPRTPIQRWFFEQGRPDAQHFNQSMLVSVPADIDADALELALAALVEHHDALRLRFTHDPTGWVQHNLGPDEGTPVRFEAPQV